MDTQRSMEERLWGYIDGLSDDQERSVIEQLLRDDRAWKAAYGELLKTHELIQSSELDQPSLRFTRNVMEEISRLHIAPATQTYINKKIIWGIAGFFFVLIVGFLVYGFTQMQWNVSSDNNLLKTVNQFDFSKLFSNTWVNVFMMLNVVIALFMLDHLLTKKRKAYRHNRSM